MGKLWHRHASESIPINNFNYLINFPKNIFLSFCIKGQNNGKNEEEKERRICSFECAKVFASLPPNGRA